MLSHPYMNRESMPIVDSIVSTALARGMAISVHDGEEWSLKKCTDAHLIWHALAQTESGDSLRFRLIATGEVIGTVYLIYENGVDVIADHSESDMMTRILAPAFNLANGL